MRDGRSPRALHLLVVVRKTKQPTAKLQRSTVALFHRFIITKAKRTVKPRETKFSAKKLTRFALCAILKVLSFQAL